MLSSCISCVALGAEATLSAVLSSTEGILNFMTVLVTSSCILSRWNRISVNEGRRSGSDPQHLVIKLTHFGGQFGGMSGLFPSTTAVSSFEVRPRACHLPAPSTCTLCTDELERIAPTFELLVTT